MPRPRYVPREFANDPDAFGKAAELRWRVGEVDPVRLDAARLQHEIAVFIRAAARQRYGSVAAYAEATGQSSDRLTKILRGAAVLQIEDLAAARLHLGLLVGPSHERASPRH